MADDIDRANDIAQESFKDHWLKPNASMPHHGQTVLNVTHQYQSNEGAWVGSLIVSIAKQFKKEKGNGSNLIITF